MTIHIPPFLLGVIATILAELALLVISAIVKTVRMRKYGKNN